MDVVVTRRGEWRIGVEVKYREHIDARALGLDDLIRAEPGTVPLLVTKHPTQYGALRPGDPASPFQIPAFLFLYLLGEAERRAVAEPASAQGTAAHAQGSGV